MDHRLLDRFHPLTTVNKGVGEVCLLRCENCPPTAIFSGKLSTDFSTVKGTFVNPVVGLVTFVYRLLSSKYIFATVYTTEACREEEAGSASRTQVDAHAGARRFSSRASNRQDSHERQR
jgi:hypothetical protein